MRSAIASSEPGWHALVDALEGAIAEVLIPEVLAYYWRQMDSDSNGVVDLEVNTPFIYKYDAVSG